MFRIDDPSAAAALPTPEAAGTEGYFTEGNPGGGVPATLVRGSFLNMLQEEIRAVVVAGGLAPSKTTYNQLLLALRAAGTFTTAARFDNTTKVATTAFLKTRGIEGSGIVQVSTSTALTSAHVGGTVATTSASATTQTLPAASGIPAGGEIEFFNIGTGVATISRAGSDLITVNSSGVTTLTVGGGDTLRLRSDGVSAWLAVGGTGQLSKSAAFLSTLASPGYQKLPSGFLLQWGTATLSGSAASVTYPLAFTSVLNVMCGTPSQSQTTTSVTVTNTTCSFASNAATGTFYWQALGAA